MECLNPAPALDLGCIVSAAKEVFAGNFSVEVVRVFLQQTDAAVDMFGGVPLVSANETSMADLPTEDLANRVIQIGESVTQSEDVAAQAVPPELVTILLLILQRLLERL